LSICSPKYWTAGARHVILFLVNTTNRNAMLPTAGETVNVTIPSLRTLVVKRFTSEETGEFLAPVSDSVVVVKAENTVESVAKTVRPARRNRA
jgi:hypothetical protein